MSLLKGTFILSIAQYISKILGFIYIIPFIALIGTQGYILFEYAYKPYTLMLSMATLGVPLAISKFVSKYNKLKDFETTKRLFKYGIVFSIFTGMITSGILFFLAPSITLLLVDPNDLTGNTVDDVVYVIRLISVALLFVPVMSIIRGYFQGHGAMIPTAVSQVLEQLTRVLFILATSFLIIETYNGEIKDAVGMATFAASLGAIMGLITLLWFLKYWKDRILKPIDDEEKKPSTVKTKYLLKEVIYSAIPFVIIGLGIPLFQLIETFTINKPLMSIGYSQIEAETINSLIALVQKLILIPVGLATAFGLALVPAVTQAFTVKDTEQLYNHITKTFQVLFWVLMPTIILMMLFSESFFGLMFGMDNMEKGGWIMTWYAPSTILYSFFIVTGFMLQGINKDLFAVFSLLMGVMTKLLLNPFFVMQFEAIGTILTTNIGFLISIILNLWGLKKFANYSFTYIFGQMKIITKISIFLIVVTLSLKFILIKFFQLLEVNLYVEHVSILFISLTISGIFYLVLSFKTNILFELLGEQYRFLKRIKKRQKIKK